LLNKIIGCAITISANTYNGYDIRTARLLSVAAAQLFRGRRVQKGLFSERGRPRFRNGCVGFCVIFQYRIIEAIIYQNWEFAILAIGRFRNQHASW
jgi:hypothetical protein